VNGGGWGIRRLRAAVVALTVALGVAVAASYGLVTEPALAASAQTVTRGPDSLPRIALTFDDTFRPEYTLPTIQVLREYGVPATFFVTGWYVMNCPEINRELVAGGFEIGDHTMSHPDLSKLTYEQLLTEIGGGTDTFAWRLKYRTVPYMRPPGGKTSPLVAKAAAARGFTHVVQWDIDSDDWKGSSADAITRRVLNNAHNGAIVLFHCSAPNTHLALPAVIEGLRAAGYELVTVSGLLKGSRRFVDVSGGSPAAEAIARLVKGGLMSGYDQDWFGPNDSIKRAQFAKVAVLATGLHTEPVEALEASFADVARTTSQTGAVDPYPFDFVEEAAAAGIIRGLERDGVRYFEPGAALSRLQLARMMARMARTFKCYPDALPDRATVAFTDVPEDARMDVQLLSQLGIMQGYSDGTFRSENKATRAQVAVVISRYLDLQRY